MSFTESYQEQKFDEKDSRISNVTSKNGYSISRMKNNEKSLNNFHEFVPE